MTIIGNSMVRMDMYHHTVTGLNRRLDRLIMKMKHTWIIGTNRIVVAMITITIQNRITPGSHMVLRMSSIDRHLHHVSGEDPLWKTFAMMSMIDFKWRGGGDLSHPPRQDVVG